MSSVGALLRRIDGQLEDSMGQRFHPTNVTLSPVARPQDVGRRPVRNVGTIDIEQVIPDPNQPRQQFSDEELERLAASIRTKGQLSPIRVRWHAQLQKWMIVAGERRWRATRLAGIPTIACHFHEAELTPSEVLEQQLIENCLRADLSPMEEAGAFRALISLNDWTGKQVAQALCIPESTVSRRLALLKLPVDLQLSVDSGKLPARTGYELTKIKDPTRQRELAHQAQSRQLTVEAVSHHSRKKAHPRAQSRGVKLPFVCSNGVKTLVTSSKPVTYHDIEQALLDALEEVRHRIANDRSVY